MTVTTEFYWHIHHDQLCERLIEPIEARRAYIRENKPQEEQELRLRLLQPVRGALPPAIVATEQAVVDTEQACTVARQVCSDRLKAHTDADVERADLRQAYFDAWHACADVWEAYSDALKARGDAWWSHVAEIEALHRHECPDCPWDGTTIFAGGNK